MVSYFTHFKSNNIFLSLCFKTTRSVYLIICSLKSNKFFDATFTEISNFCKIWNEIYREHQLKTFSLVFQNRR